jgi:glycosyltransferase involved in cell wall biosynthesis
MNYSAFTYAHNCIAGGYPIREAIRAVKPFVSEVVAVDCDSTDGTRDVLESLGCKVLRSRWGRRADGVMSDAMDMHINCMFDNVIFFEADEVWSDGLIRRVVENGITDALVYRVQVEQNFQRLRWGPHLVHRVFKRGRVRKNGHTTDMHPSVVEIIPPEYGYIWDCTYCFRDNWVQRVKQNAELWDEAPQRLRRTPLHFLAPPKAMDFESFMAEKHWTDRASPFDLPEVLKPLVGVTKYA